MWKNLCTFYGVGSFNVAGYREFIEELWHVVQQCTFFTPSNCTPFHTTHRKNGAPNLAGNIVWDHLFAVKKWAGSPPTQLELRLGLLVLTFPHAIQLDRQDHDEDHPSADSTGEIILIYYQLLEMLDILFCLFAICLRTLTACWQGAQTLVWAQTLVTILQNLSLYGVRANWSLGSLSQLVFGL